MRPSPQAQHCAGIGRGRMLQGRRHFKGGAPRGGLTRRRSLAAIVAVAVLAAVASLIGATAAHATPPTIHFDGSPGTAAPPANLGGYAMTAFPADPQADSTDVTTVAGPTGTLTFTAAVSHRTVPSSWSTWSHGYTGDVYWNYS